PGCRLAHGRGARARPGASARLRRRALHRRGVASYGVSRVARVRPRRDGAHGREPRCPAFDVVAPPGVGAVRPAERGRLVLLRLRVLRALPVRARAPDSRAALDLPHPLRSEVDRRRGFPARAGPRVARGHVLRVGPAPGRRAAGGARGPVERVPPGRRVRVRRARPRAGTTVRPPRPRPPSAPRVPALALAGREELPASARGAHAAGAPEMTGPLVSIVMMSNAHAPYLAGVAAARAELGSRADRPGR